MNGRDDVIVVMDKGQVLCHRSDCTIAIKFDEGAVQTISGSRPDSHRSDVVFLDGAQGIIAKMKKAKAMMVELRFYQVGPRVLKFDVQGLDWPPAKK